jgi:parallel beta-helix repeat protein
MVLALFNTPLFKNFVGLLDGHGQASAEFNSFGPLPSDMAGRTLYFAYALKSPWDFISNPVPVRVLAPEVWVDDDFGPATPGWQETAYDTIQHAIDGVAPGGIVHVQNGTYQENVWVYRSVTLSGEDQNNTIIDGGGFGPGVRITADGVAFSGFCVRNGGREGLDAGLSVFSDFCTITGNRVQDNLFGLLLFDAQNASVSQNVFLNDGVLIVSEKKAGWNTHAFTYNTVNGLQVRYYKNGTGGTVPPNMGQVILAHCKDFTVQNQSFANVGCALQAGFTTNSLFQGNTFSNTVVAAYLEHSPYNRLYMNNLSTSTEDGVYLRASHFNQIENNTVTLSGDDGIDLEQSRNNQIFDNTITNCEGGAIDLEDYSKSNAVYNNFLQNNGFGIELDSFADFNQVYENDCLNNGYGVILEYTCSENDVYKNTIDYNGTGIGLYDQCGGNDFYENGVRNNQFGMDGQLNCSNNRIFDNAFEFNQYYGLGLNATCNENEFFGNSFSFNQDGLKIIWCQDNVIYNNNFIANLNSHAFEDAATNQWYTDYPIGGNYWDDHPGASDDFQGPNQDQAGSDGIIDQGFPLGGLYPYDILVSNNQDIYPWKSPF